MSSVHNKNNSSCHIFEDVVSEGCVILVQKIKGHYSSQDEREQESGQHDGMCLCQ